MAPPEADSGRTAVVAGGHQIRSSSLSLLSDRTPSPRDDSFSTAPKGNAPVELDTPVQANGQRGATDGATRASPSANTARRAAAALLQRTPSAADSLSELESDDDASTTRHDDAASETSALPASSQESSFSPQPAEIQTPVPAGPKKRGRPLGSKNKQLRPPIPRAQRAAARAAAESVAPVSPARGAGAKPRATRANVTLPPGYIYGVTSSRWPPRKKDGDESGEGAAEHDDEDEYTEERTPKADRKGKGRAVKRDEDEDELMSDGEDERGTPMSREQSMEGPPTPQRAGPGRPKGKGKKGAKKGQVVPEPVERAKRRKLEPDEHSIERAAAREAARHRFLEQLEDEAELVQKRKHPLIGLAHRRLAEEKAHKLEQLRLAQELRELELERLAEARVRASWRQWADRKDTLRTELYFENHHALKDLIAEERLSPFFRNHPLINNTHDLPPAPFFRGPVRDPAFIPRSVIHAGHYVEPPPLNPALEHTSWRLSPSEIEADLALFYDIDDGEPAADAAPVPSAAVPPPAGAGMYPYPPPFYFNPAVPPPPGAGPPPYMVTSAAAPGPPAPPVPNVAPYPVPGMPSVPFYPPPHYAAPPPHQASPSPAGMQPQPPPRPAPPLAQEPRPPPPPQPVASSQPPLQPSPVVPRSSAPPPAASPATAKVSPSLPKKTAPMPGTSLFPSMNGQFVQPPPPSQAPPPHPQPQQYHHHEHAPHPAANPAPPTFPPPPAVAYASKPSLPSFSTPAFSPTPPAQRPGFPPAHSSSSLGASPPIGANGHSHHAAPIASSLPTRSPLPPPASAPTPTLAAPALASSAAGQRTSPAVSAPRLPSLTHRSPTVTSTFAGSPPLPSIGSLSTGSAVSGPSPLPSLFAGMDRPGAPGSGPRPPILGLGGMLNGAPPGSAPLGYGPATGLPLPSWLKPLGKAAAPGEAKSPPLAARAEGPTLPPLQQHGQPGAGRQFWA
ncbi:hypothetical protein JCM10213v2_000318 [Rhodosporidiobolus nylandii]